jgi:hypothetical protein
MGHDLNSFSLSLTSFLAIDSWTPDGALAPGGEGEMIGAQRGNGRDEAISAPDAGFGRITLVFPDA